MIRLPAIGAAAFALATARAADVRACRTRPGALLTHRDTRGQLQDVNLAEVVATAQAAAATAPTACRPRGAATRPTTDDTANAVTPATKAQFKVVYAYAADRPNRFAGWKDALQANVAIVQRFLSAQDGGTKGLRFDMGTALRRRSTSTSRSSSCPARAPPTPTTSARSPAPSSARSAPPAAPRNAIVLADGLVRRHAGVRARRDDHGRDRRAARAPRTSTTAAA